MSVGLLFAPAEWEKGAACREPGGGDWMLTDGRSGKILTHENRIALGICRATCPVRQQCLEQAVERRDQGVIAGGVVLGEPMRWVTCHCGRRFLYSRHKAIRCCSKACEESPQGRALKAVRSESRHDTRGSRCPAAKTEGRRVVERAVVLDAVEGRQTRPLTVAERQEVIGTLIGWGWSDRRIAGHVWWLRGAKDGRQAIRRFRSRWRIPRGCAEPQRLSA